MRELNLQTHRAQSAYGSARLERHARRTAVSRLLVVVGGRRGVQAAQGTWTGRRSRHGRALAWWALTGEAI